MTVLAHLVKNSYSPALLSILFVLEASATLFLARYGHFLFGNSLPNFVLSATFLLLISLLVVITFLIFLTKPWSRIRPLTIPPIILLLLIIGIGFLFRITHTPRHYLYHDEEVYIHEAQMISYGQGLTLCDFGVFQKDTFECFFNCRKTLLH